MKLARVLLVIGVVALGYKWWQGEGIFARPATVEVSANGFISIVTPAGAADNTVIVFAPENCPSEAAQRAEHLQRRLRDAGIPTVRSTSYHMQIMNPTREEQAALERTSSVLGGELPIVLVRGKGKANPTVEEVTSEYRGAT
jgi:hypothetical protein